VFGEFIVPPDFRPETELPKGREAEGGEETATSVWRPVLQRPNGDYRRGTRISSGSAPCSPWRRQAYRRTDRRRRFGQGVQAYAAGSLNRLAATVVW